MPTWQKVALGVVAVAILWIAVFTAFSCAVGDTESGNTDSGAYPVSTEPVP